MPERQPEPTPLDQALTLLGQTYKNTHRMRVDRYEAERQATDELHELRYRAGKIAVNYYIKQELPDKQAIGQSVDALVSAGMAWLKAEALRTGVEKYLPATLKETDAEIARLLGSQMLHARAARGVLPHSAVGLATRGGTRHYDIPSEGVSGTFVQSDSEWGRLYLSHPEAGNTWAVELFQDAATLEPKAIVTPVLAEA